MKNDALIVHGNVEGLRDSLLAEMAELYHFEIEPGMFAPPALLKALARYTARINREISVYISRGGEVLDVTVGGIDSVPLSEWRLRRSTRRLSCVRCIHTHPGGCAELSDVDVTALKSLWFDAMVAVGVSPEGRVTGVSAAFLGEMAGGVPQPIVLPPVILARVPQEEWLHEIELSDQRVLRGDGGELKEQPERALLVGAESEESLDELAALAESAGAAVVGRMFQRRPKPDNATYIGSGKAEELRLEAQALEAGVIIFDDELSGIQTRNLENIAETKVIDRTTLILDIFAQRAKSREGKLQVALAQLRYQSSRLIGQGLVLSRLAGGIGTRGPGETKLEIDRRRIRERITELRRELEDMERQRALRRKSRERGETPVVALVGYTNTGKSTLLNRLSDAGVYAQDQLFATLDAVSRRVPLPGGGEFLLVDTVGFIRKLPHELVQAFRSTLEEAALADVLLIVSDASSPDMSAQRALVEEVLAQLGATEQPRIDVLNKCDKAAEQPLIPGAVRISAATGEGVPELLEKIAALLRRNEAAYDVLVPFSRYALLGELHAQGRVLDEAHTDAGTRLRVMLATQALGRLRAKYPDAAFERA